MNRTMPSHSLVGPSGSRAISAWAVDPPLSALAVALTISRCSLHVHGPTAPRKVGGALPSGRGRCAPRRQSLLRSYLAPHSFPRRPPATCYPRSELGSLRYQESTSLVTRDGTG